MTMPTSTNVSGVFHSNSPFSGRLSVPISTLCLVGLAILLVSGPAKAEGGFIFGFNLGGALVNGDRNVDMDLGPWVTGDLTKCKNATGELKKWCDDWFRTDAGSGFAFDIHLGYNFFGYAAIETYAAGNLNMDSGGGKFEGTGYWGFLGRYFPLQHFAGLRDLKFDPSLYFGGGFVTWNGYHLEYHPEHKMKGWSGIHYMFGVACDYYLNKSVSVGIDLRFLLPQYKTFYEDWDDDITFEPAGSASSFVFSPMATINFHLLDPEE